MSARRCKAKTKAGRRCKAKPLRTGDFCLAHADADTRASTGFVPEAGKLGGRPRMPTPSEIARRLIEQNELALQRPYWRTLGYDVKVGPDGPYLVELEGGGAKLHGESREGVVKVSKHEDLGAMITAAEKLQDRVYGKPKQTTEISGPEGQPVEITLPDADDWHRQVASVLAQTGATA